MKVSLQLYVNGQQVELFEDESITLTQSIQDVRDISKIFTEFTRQFSIPASKNNNRVFQHFYNQDIVDGLDARQKIDAVLYLNHQLFKNGKVKLKGSTLKNNKPHTYRIVFFGNTVNLKDLVGETSIASLLLLRNFTFDYNSTNIKNALSTAVDITSDGEIFKEALLFPIITHTQRLIYDSSQSTANTATQANVYHSGGNHGLELTQLKPALNVYAIIRAIEKQYFTPQGYKFSTDFFYDTNPNLCGLYMWMHNKAGALFEDQEKIESFTNYAHVHGLTTVVNVDSDTNSFESPSRNAGRKEKTRQRRMSFEVIPSGSQVYTIYLYKDGEIFKEYSELTGTQTGIETALVLPKGIYSFGIKSNSAGTFTLNARVEFTRKTIFNTTSPSRDFTMSASIGTDTTLDLERYIPDIKVIDFLRAIFNMFNLTASVQNDKTVKIQTLDDFYANSTTTYDITKDLDKTSSMIDTVMPYRQINFEYEGRDSFFAKNHERQFYRKWGCLDYDATQHPSPPDNVLDGSVYEIKIPFEHHKFERLIDGNSSVSSPTNQTKIQWGWSVDEKQQPTIGKPLLFYPVLSSGTNLSVIDIEGNVSSKSSYFVPSNSINLEKEKTLLFNVKKINTSDNINFNSEINEFAFVPFTETLFEKYYKSYIEEVFDVNRRLTKVKAHLNYGTLLNLSLADIIIIFNRKYKINKITTNFETLVSDLELINTHKEISGTIPSRFLTNEVEIDESGRTICELTADRTNIRADNGLIKADADCNFDGKSIISANEVLPQTEKPKNTPVVKIQNEELEVVPPVLSFQTPTSATSSVVYMKFKVTTLGTIGDLSQIAEYGFFYSTNARNDVEQFTSSTAIEDLKSASNVTHIQFLPADVDKFTAGKEVQHGIPSLSNTFVYYRFYGRTNTDIAFDTGDFLSPTFVGHTSQTITLTATTDVREYTKDATTEVVDIRITHSDGTVVDLQNLSGEGARFFSKTVPVVIAGSSGTFTQVGTNRTNSGFVAFLSNTKFGVNALHILPSRRNAYNATSRTTAEIHARLGRNSAPEVGFSNRTNSSQYIFPLRAEGFSLYSKSVVKNTEAASGIALAADGFYAYYGFDLDGNFSRSTGVSAEVVNGIVTNRRLYY
tara:strand:+ start:1849 stop:5214 length:3366 start_codon:yes stop_codon:yes gene_type:complete